MRPGTVAGNEKVDAATVGGTAVSADAGGGRVSRAVVPVAGPAPPGQVGALASAEPDVPSPTVAASALAAPTGVPGRTLPIAAAVSALVAAAYLLVQARREGA